MSHNVAYLSAEALGIKEWERDELIKLWPQLERGEHELDMQNSSSQECGSACCIGGHIARAHGMTEARDIDYYVVDDCRDDFEIETRSDALAPLFFPPSDNFFGKPHPSWNATGPQGARAIYNFLTTGNPEWDAVMLKSSSL
jgi:hypothetical protein